MVRAFLSDYIRRCLAGVSRALLHPGWRLGKLAACFLLMLAGERASAADSFPPSATGGFWAGCTGGLVLSLLVAVCCRTRVRRAECDIARLKEAAEHCERERNLAQQELVRRLEEERELAKEKMQFESQLSDYEKYASLAQLALGAAHEINNPLMGIMSHLELERREADAERREEIDQCIEAASGSHRPCAGCWITPVRVRLR